MSDQEFTIPSSLPGVINRIRLRRYSRAGRFKIDVQTTTAIPQSFLDERQREQQAALANNHGRAPVGDKHGAWQKVAEIPLSLLMQRAPEAFAEAGRAGFSFADQDKLRKLINDSDFKKLRSDVPERTF
jgi:hypothetical protein